MKTPQGKTAAADALVGLWAVALTSFVIATLFFARDFLIPLALAALLTFLLSPLVARIERWLGRIAAVLLVVTIIFAVTGAVGWVLTRQPVDLASKLPDYKRKHSDKATFYQGSDRWRVQEILGDDRGAEKRPAWRRDADSGRDGGSRNA